MSEKQKLVKTINDMVLDYNEKVGLGEILDCLLWVNYREIPFMYQKDEQKNKTNLESDSLDVSLFDLSDILIGFISGVVFSGLVMMLGVLI